MLQSATLELHRGETASLIGASGSGKSTLLGLIAGLMQPTSGTIAFDGRDLTAMDDAERAQLRGRRIGFVLQNGNLIPFLTAGENVELAMQFSGGGPARRRDRPARARALLAELGLAGRADHLPRQLSGGEAQRVSVAVALANEPDLLLADEVTGELDSASADQVMTVIFDVSRGAGLTVLFVTHSRELARARPASVPAAGWGGEPAMTAPAGITLESVSRHYTTPAGIVRAVDGVSFDVPPGRNIAITGPSGCGKSTLLGLIGALDRPTSGRIVVGGHELSSLPERDRARVRRDELGLVFQSDNLLPFLTAHENVCLQLSLTGAPEVDDRSLELLELLGVAECAEKLPDQLSGGQRQRVAVARALVHRPRVVLADEPTGSLDDESSAILVDLLLAVQREAGSTLVVVTHDLAVAGRLDRTIRIHDGRLAADSAGDPASVLEGLRG